MTTQQSQGSADAPDLTYVRGAALGTVPCDRRAGRAPSEEQMLLEMELRLRVAAKTNRVVIGNNGWWSSRPAEADPVNGPPSGDRAPQRRMTITVPESALMAAGREKTAENLGMVTEMTTHARIMNDGPPPELRTGDAKKDDAIAAYIAGAARDRTEQFALTGRFGPSQSDLPPDEREPLFIDLEYFDEMIAAEHGKRLTEDDLYKAAGAVEARYFDPATAAEARDVQAAITRTMTAPGSRAHQRHTRSPDDMPAAKPIQAGGDPSVPTPPGRHAQARDSRTESAQRSAQQR